jgi:hypothetical protein
MAVPFTTITGSASIGATEFSLPTSSTTLTAQTTSGGLETLIDLTNMVAGDQYQIRATEKVNGGTAQTLWIGFATGAQTGLYRIPKLDVNEGWSVNMKLITGSARTVSWSLKQHTGDVNAATVGSGAITSGSFASGAITAAAFAASAITSTIIAAAAIGASQLADAAITASKFAANAIDSNALATSAVTEIQTGLPLASDYTSTRAAKLDNLDVVGSTRASATALVGVQADIDDIQARLPATLDGSGNIKAGVQSLVGGAISSIADAVMNYVIEAAPTNATTHIQRLRVLWSLLVGKASGIAITTAGTEHVRDAADTKDRAVFTLNTDGTRTPTSVDGT